MTEASRSRRWRNMRRITTLLELDSEPEIGSVGLIQVGVHRIVLLLINQGGTSTPAKLDFMDAR